MNTKLVFVLRITIIHVITYVICGIFFSYLFDYQKLFELGNVKYFMHGSSGDSSLIGPLIQVVRGILFGLTLLLIKDSIWGKSFAWLRLWFLLVVIGIISTYAPAPGSIEGIVYTQLPLEFHLKGAPEVWIQSLIFSVWATNSITLKVPKKYKVPAITTAVSGAMFSVCGIFIALALDADIMACASDTGAFIVMGVSLAVVFVMSQLYICAKISSLIYYFCCYVALAGFPTLYNYSTGSQLASPLSFIISGVPVVAIFFYMKIVKE